MSERKKIIAGAALVVTAVGLGVGLQDQNNREHLQDDPTKTLTPTDTETATLSPIPTMDSTKIIEDAITRYQTENAPSQTPTLVPSSTATETPIPTATLLDSDQIRTELLGKNRIGAWDAGESLPNQDEVDKRKFTSWVEKINKYKELGVIKRYDIRTHDELMTFVGLTQAWKYSSFTEARNAVDAAPRYTWMVTDTNGAFPKAYQMEDVLRNQARDILKARGKEPTTKEVDTFYRKIQQSLFGISGKGKQTQLTTRNTFTGSTKDIEDNDQERRIQPENVICSSYIPGIEIGQEYIATVKGNKTLFLSNKAKMLVLVDAGFSPVEFDLPNWHTGIVAIPGTDYFASFAVNDLSSQPKNELFGLPPFAENPVSSGWGSNVREGCGSSILPTATPTPRPFIPQPGKPEQPTQPSKTKFPTDVPTQPPFTKIPPTESFPTDIPTQPAPTDIPAS